jgi:hypothetical protein
MLNVATPSGATNPRQYGSSIIDIRFICRAVAGIGMLVNSVRNANFTRLSFFDPLIAAVKTTTLGNANLAESSDTQRCIFDRISVRAIDSAPVRAAHGLWLTSHQPIGSNSNTSLNIFSQCDLQMWGGSGSGHGIFLEDGDNNTFNNVRVTRTGGTTVAGVQIVGNTACGANHFWNLNASGANGIVLKGIASGFVADTQGNSFWVTDAGNGTLYPTADAGIYFTFHADAGEFVNLPIAQLPVGDNITTALAARAAIGTATSRVSNGSGNHIVLTDETNVWGISINGATGLRIVRLAGAGNFNLGSLLEAMGGVVSVGAADSGGAGFKVLRIPN